MVNGINRGEYFNYIERKLGELSYRISIRNKINLQDLNIYSETFFADMVSLLLKIQLKNMNTIKPNIEGIDLIDETNKIFAQVSATCTKEKIEASLSKDILIKYPNFRFKFIAITGDARKLRKAIFSNPHDIIFTPATDIIDIPSLLSLINAMDIDNLRSFYDLIVKELGSEYDPVKFDSNLTTIINILATEDLTRSKEHININPYEIERKIEFNDLGSIRLTIDEHKIYYGKLEEKYKEFDKQGLNKSLSVFSLITQQYIKLSNSDFAPHEIFFSLIDSIIEIITNSKNYIEIPIEELQLCVTIIIVDAFIRCKIFKNPEDYNYVTT